MEEIKKIKEIYSIKFPKEFKIEFFNVLDKLKKMGGVEWTYLPTDEGITRCRVEVDENKIQLFNEEVSNFFNNQRTGHYNKNFPKTIEIGGLTKAELIDILMSKGYKITEQALYLIYRSEFVIGATKKTIKLACRTPKQMGFNSKNVSWEQIRAWIQRNGELCQDDEIALRLRLNYEDQPLEESLHIAYDYCYFRVANYHNEKYVFRNGCDSNSDGGYPNDFQFIYVEKN
jgi:hypothetical protein